MMRWERAKVKAEAGGRGRKGGTAGPGKRWGHTCSALKNGRFLYVFGGYGKDNRQTNDIHVFDTAKQTWSKPMVKGTPPSPRDSHTCTTVGTSLYVFGGTDGKSPLQDLYILDTVTNTWAQPQVSGDGPAPREGHCAALIGLNLFIFGGCGKTLDEGEEVYFNDLYMLDTVKLHWTRAVTKGTSPVPRDSHTCSAWDNKLIVLGGEDATDSYLADVQILDTDAMEWRELQTSGQLLTPRAGHATVSIGKHIFVFGGFTDDRKLFDDLHMLNLETGVWSKVVTDGVGPSPRFSVAGDYIDARSGGILVFIGGCNDNLEALDDMYYLDTEMQSEKAQDERPEKFSLRKELKRKRQENQPSVKSPEVQKEVPLLPAPALKASVPLNTAVPATMPASPAVGAANVKSSLYEFKPAEEKIFQAKIKDVFHYGYTIESVVDGKLLRGLLFSYKPGFAHAVHAYLTRKKLSSDGYVDNAKGDKKSKLNIAHSLKQTDGTASDFVGGGESLATPLVQHAYIPDQYQHYSHPQMQSQPQHQPPYQQQSHFLYQQQQVRPLHQHASAPPHQQQHSPALFPTHQQLRVPISAPTCTVPQQAAPYQQQHSPVLFPTHQQLRVPISAPTCTVPQQDSRHFTESIYGGTLLSSREVSPYQVQLHGTGGFSDHGSFASSQGLPQPSNDASPHQASGQDACDPVMQDPPSSSQVTPRPSSESSLQQASGEGDDGVTIHHPPSSSPGGQISREQAMSTHHQI